MKVIVIYDQIRFGLGTKDDTVIPLTDRKEPIGPAIMMEPFLKQVGGHVTAYLYCGNGTPLADPEGVSRKLCAMVNKLQPDVVMCGPAFNFADYAGMYVKMACDINAATKAKALAAMSAESKDTIAIYKDKVAIVKIPKKGSIGLNDTFKDMYTLAKALADGSDTTGLKHKFCFKQGRIYRMWGMITAWRMAVEGITEGTQVLRSGGDIGDIIEFTIRKVEDFPYYKSAGHGGLPNEEIEAEMDAVFMDGSTLDIGAVAVIRDFANPVSIARHLSHGKVNNLLVAEGAKEFIHKEGFGRKNMLTSRVKAHYRKHIEGMSAQAASQKPKPYSGHDTVDMTCLDVIGRMTAATSTNRFLMKKKGKAGGSPISGPGFYADSKKGTASATGLGEDLMKDYISYGIVRLMGEGMHPQGACEAAVPHLDMELRERRGEAGNLSIVAMNPKGEWGVATNIEGFSSVVVAKSQEPAVYLMTRQEDGRYTYEQTSGEWTENYMKARIAPIRE